ncbi:MAG: sulfotransferase [Alphaproteobacteria bacterium]
MNPDFVICGVEHSGTTLISDLFRQSPHFDAGFEVGVLLCPSPRTFPTLQPFADNLLAGWGISEEDRAYCCDTDRYEAFYDRLKCKSSILKSPDVRIFDKTPRYFEQLGPCLDKVPVPFVASYKDPRAIVGSDFKRCGTSDFFGWFDEYCEAKLAYLMDIYHQHQDQQDNDRVLFVALEHLAFAPQDTVRTLFDHVGADFETDYMVMKNLRYDNTRANIITPEIVMEYRDTLGPDHIRAVEDAFSALKDWFYQI